MEKIEVQIISEEKPKYQPLKGKIFVLTGTLESIVRSEAEKKIRLFGGHPSSSVSKKTDFLVAGKEPGSSKLETAKKFGIKIIEEKEFLKMISQP